ncbi:MAG: hypothetical protein M1839_007950 [Geoglossum umbratile]|nr:MAG: hypothetical protein M1839_007950 [Geoglossum umbratile]
MRISQSLRGVSLSQAQLTPYGFDYDRRFMLLRVDDAETQQYTNLLIGRFLKMGLFTTEILFPHAGRAGEILIRYTTPGESPEEQKMLRIPLQPEVKGLQEVNVTMHQSATMAYNMGAKYNDWFSERLGYDVILAYLGDNLRPVLGNLSPNAEKVGDSGWLSTIANSLSLLGMAKKEQDRITFTDVAPFLVVTEASLDDVSARLPEDQEMDITKFRPNIVLSGSPTPWDEDFWGELTIGTNDNTALQIPLTGNCARCQSININYATGEPGSGEAGSVLKKLMKDRRVDAGMKYSPVFGRYGFVGKGGAGKRVTVGDEVAVMIRNEKRTKLGMYTLHGHGRYLTNRRMAWFDELMVITMVGGMYMHDISQFYFNACSPYAHGL